MIIQPSNLAALTWAGAAAGTMSDSWRVGSVLGGRVLDRTAFGQLILQVGALTVEAEIADAAMPPRHFQARVLSNGPVPVLELVDNHPESPLTGLLRSQLPRQGGYAPLLSHLQGLARRPVARQLPEPARFALAMLEGSMHTPAEISTPQGLREAIMRSGLFFEHDLVQAVRGQKPPLALQQDWKGALLRVIRVLDKLPASVPRSSMNMNTNVNVAEVAPPLRFRPLLPQGRLLPPDPSSSNPVQLLAGLHEHSRAALARLEIAQIEAHPANAPGTWLVELPVRNRDGADIVQVRIERDPDHGSPPAEETGPAGPWTLGFAVNLPGLGPVQGDIRLDGNRVQVRLWADEESAVQRIEAQLPALSQKLEKAGLQLLQMHCRRGSPQPAAAFSAPLVDASA